MAEATRNMITEVLDPFNDNPNTVHIVANAIYFMGEWRNPFKEENTVDREFLRLDGSSVELYYSLPRFSMCIFLPDGRKGLRSLVEKIASSPEFLHDHLPKEYVPVGQFRLPKFKLSFERMIIDDLENLGLQLPFDKETAKMTGMLFDGDRRGLYVSRVIHKAVIEMNEERCVAAAVTVESDDDIGFSLYDDYPPPPKPVNFVADHPFAFFIVEEMAGAVVFAGHVLEPTKEENGGLVPRRSKIK
ncbi:hypothetical protein BS78_05G128700 [Paspalum vaginatum]|nr:hypothetical protein BS78_05G128700 [Paspalum vaginatum]